MVENAFHDTRRQHNVGLELGPFRRQQQYIIKPTVGQGVSFTGSNKYIICFFIEPAINIIIEDNY